jgi:hypothetical protein
MTGLMQIGGRLASVSSGLGSYTVPEDPGGGEPAAGNTMLLRNVSGSTITNYPLRFQRAFAEGEIADYPQILVDDTPITTQADVKARWDDDSVKHCILSAIVASAANATDLELTFQNQVSGNNTALTKEEMQHADFDFDAVISLDVSSVLTASARAMLDADDYVVWCAGQIATTIILGDHSTGAAYDMDWGGSVPFRPTFIATFWNASKRVEIAAIGEQTNAEALGDLTGDLVITKGDASPTSAYTNGDLVTYVGSRWVVRFWIGTAPSAAVTLNHNLTYLKDTLAFPNYDTAISVTEGALSSVYSLWQSKSTDLYDAGWWTKAMSTSGGRPEIGPMPRWSALWLYTGDYRMREIALKQADLAAAWPMHFRESATGKRLLRSEGAGSTGMGLPISAADRRTTSLASGYSYSETVVGDRLKVLGANVSSGWTSDLAHQPDAFSTAYALTGDPFYLEQMHFWASYSVHVQNGAANTEHYGRGPTGAEGGLYFGESRAAAWLLRNRALACYWTPDDHAMKECLEVMMDDGLAHWEGRFAIAGGAYTAHAVYTWADGENFPTTTNPLHFMSKDSDKLSGGQSNWMVNYGIVALGIAKDLGWDTDAILEWLSVWYFAMLTDEDFNPFMMSDYQQKTGPTGNSVFYSDWADVKAGGLAGDQTKTEFANEDVEHGYDLIATCASAYLTHITGGPAARTFMEEECYDVFPDTETNPKWCILPRA